MTQAQARNPVIDVARGVGILLIVFGHNPLVLQEKGELYNVIYSFHVPLFLLLSGLVMAYDRPFKEVLVRKSDAYLKPYFVSLCLASIFYLPTQRIPPLKYLAKVLFASGLTIPWQWAALWFLPHLWTVAVLSSACYALTRLDSRTAAFKCGLLGVLLILGYMGVMAVNLPSFLSAAVQTHGLPFSLDLLLIGTFFFLLGSLAKEHVLHFEVGPLRFGLAALTFTMLHVMGSYTMDLNLRRYDHVVFTTAESLLGIYLVLAGSVVMLRWPTITQLFSHFGSASLMLLVLHSFVQHFAYGHLASRLGERPLARSLLSYLVAVLIPLAADALLRRSTLLSWLFLAVPRRVLWPSGNR